VASERREDKPEGRKQAMRKRWLRLLPIMMITFIISFMDRTNISFAIPTMGKELALTSTIMGFASGVLFLGYGVSQIFGGWIADRGYGRMLITLMLVLWGATELAQAFVTSITELVVIRFLLGLFEGSIFPTFLLFVKNWFGPNERARANGVWQLCYPLAALLSGPIAGYILAAGTWRELFIFEGVLPILWAVVWFWGAADTPLTARWLSPEDRRELMIHLASQPPLVAAGNAGKATFTAQITRLPVILFALVIFLWNIGFLGFTIWLPSVIAQGRSLDPATVGWLSAAPFAVSIVVMQCMTFVSDRIRNRRTIAACAIAICGLVLVVGGLTFETNSIAINMSLLVVSGALLYGSQPVLWSIPADMLPGNVAGAVMGAINGIGVLGAFLGPYVVGFARNLTDSFSASLWVMGLCLLAASLLISQLRLQPRPALVHGIRTEA
jgi:sugar phosphate permease